MALTKLMHMKQTSKGSPAKHLKNAIHYILNPEKTQGGIWVGGNSGNLPEEVIEVFLKTKQEVGKTEGRQGYHFVISFKESATAEEVYRVMQDFCNLYLQDAYDYVFSVHNDANHIHAHVIFNSVSRTTGLKYHYKKGDWKKHIQSVTDQVCQKNGFKKFDYEGKDNNDYGTWETRRKGGRTWWSIIKTDIDYQIRSCSGPGELQEKLVTLGYTVRSGTSKIHGAYWSITPEGGKKAVRTYQLGEEYTVSGLKQQIKEIQSGLKEPELSKKPPTIKKQISKLSSDQIIRQHSSGQKLFLTSYQYYYVRRYLKDTVLYQYQSSRNYSDIKDARLLSENCRYLLRNHISSRDQLLNRNQRLMEQEQALKEKRAALYKALPKGEEEKLIQEYEFHRKEQDQAERIQDEAAWERNQDEIDKIEESFPISEYYEAIRNTRNELRHINYNYRVLQKEKKVVYRILDDKKEKSQVKVKERVRTNG